MSVSWIGKSFAFLGLVGVMISWIRQRPPLWIPYPVTKLTKSGFSVHHRTMQVVTGQNMPKLDLSQSPDQIKNNTARLIADYRKSLDVIGATPRDRCSFSSVLVPLAKLEAQYDTATPSLTFPQYVHPSQDIREACVAATQLLDQFSIERGMREDIFQAVKAASEHTGRELTGEEKRLVEKMLLEFKLNGLFLEPKAREELKNIREQLAEAELLFFKNVNDDQTTVLFTRDELDGCSEDFLASLERSEDDRYVVTMKYPDLFGVLKQAKNADTRKRLSLANDRRCPDNMVLLSKAIGLRARAAKMLGFADHCQFSLAERMAKSSAEIMAFLGDLRTRLRPMAQEELQTLKGMKEKEEAETGDVEFFPWDYHYYANQLMQKRYSVDHELIKCYFPMDHVVDEMLKIYEVVLSLNFREITNDPAAPKWQEDVRLFEVRDRETDQQIGHVYLDLFPRHGKYTHAACFPLQPGCSMDGESAGDRQTPVAAMVCNFSKPLPDHPSLLKHDEVVTFFHELGHAMHGMCSKTRFSRFHGTRTERDFVEAPSQMLENWCWEKGILKRLSRHYQTGEPLPDDLIDRLVRSRLVNAGLLNSRQLFFALYDMAIHQGDGIVGVDELNKTYESMRHDITLIRQAAQVFPAATWGHLMGGYDCGYYGYMWSLVFSADMYQTCFGADPLSAGAGASYRRNVLQPGGSRDGMDMLVGLLGRKPNSDAFLKQLGLQAE